MSDFPVVVTRNIPWHVMPTGERFWAEVWVSEQMLMQYDVEALIEKGLVTDPNGNANTFIDQYWEVERKNGNVLFHFRGYAPKA